MAIQKITGDVIATSAVTADSLADTTITAAKLHTTLDLTGKTVTVSTASAGDNDTTVASTAFVATAVANLADSAPDALNTLNELAAALGDDANFSTTVTNSIATKLPLAGGTMTGAVNFSDTGENIHSPSAGILAIEARGPIQLWGDSNNNGASTSAVFEVLRDSTYSGGSGKSTLTAYDNGDIKFYEDTGTTAKFVWDASAERLSLGTNSDLGYTLSVVGNAVFKTDTASTGLGNHQSSIRIQNKNTTDNNYAGIVFDASSDSPAGAIQFQYTDQSAAYGDIVFETRGTSGYIQPVRITSTGNLTVGSSQEVNIVSSGSSLFPSLKVNNNGYVGSASVTDALQFQTSGDLKAKTKLGIGIDPVELLDIKSASGDARIRLDAPSGSDTEIKFFNAGVAQYTVGHDDATDKFVIGTTNVDAPLITVSKAGTTTINGNANINGQGSTGNALDLRRGSDNAQTLKVQNSGEVVVANNYLYASHTGTAFYSQGAAVFRGNLSNDTSGQPLHIADNLRVEGTITAEASVGVAYFFKSTYNYSPNRDWAFRTNNYGSSNWGGFSLEVSGEQQGTPDIARIGVHANGNVGIGMGGAAGTGGTLNPATALHVGGDITVGTNEDVGTSGTASLRFCNDNERSRITSNYASGGGGQMGFWTDSTGGTLLERAYIKNDGSLNLNHGLKLPGYTAVNSDVWKTYSLAGPGGSTTLTRTVNVNTYWGFAAQGGHFHFSLNGWQADRAAGLIQWHNVGNATQVISGVNLSENFSSAGLTVSVAKGSGNYDIDITLTSTHSNSHGWLWKVWA